MCGETPLGKLLYLDVLLHELSVICSRSVGSKQREKQKVLI